MRFKTNLKAGILLYTMFMACVFMLVLQVYLYQISYCHKEYQAQTAYVRARLMAEMVYQTQNQDVERVVFEEGVVTSRFNKHQHVMTVTLGQKSTTNFATREILNSHPRRMQVKQSRYQMGLFLHKLRGFKIGIPFHLRCNLI